MLCLNLKPSQEIHIIDTQTNEEIVIINLVDYIQHLGFIADKTKYKIIRGARQHHANNNASPV